VLLILDGDHDRLLSARAQVVLPNGETVSDALQPQADGTLRLAGKPVLEERRGTGTPALSVSDYRQRRAALEACLPRLIALLEFAREWFGESDYGRRLAEWAPTLRRTNRGRRQGIDPATLGENEERGLTDADIGALVGMTPKAISNLRRRHNLPRHRRSRPGPR
jgi:hypothetical protein